MGSYLKKTSDKDRIGAAKFVEVNKVDSLVSDAQMNIPEQTYNRQEATIVTREEQNVKEVMDLLADTLDKIEASIQQISAIEKRRNDRLSRELESAKITTTETIYEKQFLEEISERILKEKTCEVCSQLVIKKEAMRVASCEHSKKMKTLQDYIRKSWLRQQQLKTVQLKNNQGSLLQITEMRKVLQRVSSLSSFSSSRSANENPKPPETTMKSTQLLATECNPVERYTAEPDDSGKLEMSDDEVADVTKNHKATELACKLIANIK